MARYSSLVAETLEIISVTWAELLVSSGGGEPEHDGYGHVICSRPTIRRCRRCMISPEQSSQGDALESCLSFRLQPATPCRQPTHRPTPIPSIERQYQQIRPEQGTVNDSLAFHSITEQNTCLGKAVVHSPATYAISTQHATEQPTHITRWTPSWPSTAGLRA